MICTDLQCAQFLVNGLKHAKPPEWPLRCLFCSHYEIAPLFKKCMFFEILSETLQQLETQRYRQKLYNFSVIR